MKQSRRLQNNRRQRIMAFNVKGISMAAIIKRTGLSMSMTAVIFVIATMVFMAEAPDMVYAGADGESGMEFYPLQCINSNLDETGERSLDIVRINGRPGDTVFITIKSGDAVIASNIPFTVEQDEADGTISSGIFSVERNIYDRVYNYGSYLEVFIYKSRAAEEPIWSGNVHPVFAALGDENNLVAMGSYTEGASMVPCDYVQKAGVLYHLTGHGHINEAGAMIYSYEVYQEEIKEYVKVRSLARMKSTGKTSLALTWTRTAGAEGYDIYFARNGKKLKKVKSLSAGARLRWTKKKLKKSTAYKAYVKAWRMKNGVKAFISTSPVVYAYTNKGTKKYTNPKSVKVGKTTVSLKKSGVYKIKAKVTKLDKRKKLKAFTKNLRYISSDSTVAKVSGTGRVTAMGAGSCRVYVYATNGVRKTINIKVK